MPIKKPDPKFGIEQAVWLVFVFGFLLVTICLNGCKSVETKPDRERFNRHLI